MQTTNGMDLLPYFSLALVVALVIVFWLRARIDEKPTKINPVTPKAQKSERLLPKAIKPTPLTPSTHGGTERAASNQPKSNAQRQEAAWPKATQSAPFEATTSHPVPEKETLQGSAYIVDGDTIVIKKTQIRLFGVDAPELDHPHGQKAKWALVRLCKGKTIRAEITDEDAHGRTVAKCFLPDGRDLSAEMVKAGLAIDWPKFSGGVYVHLETDDARKKMWLADARQKGRMDVWRRFEAQRKG